jgi:hypothetical protein
MRTGVIVAAAAVLSLASLPFASPAAAQGAIYKPFHAPVPVFSRAVAFDISRPVRSLPRALGSSIYARSWFEVRPENDEGPFVRPVNIFADPVVQRFYGNDPSSRLLMTFEGLNNSQNPFQVAPPDPDGAIGRTNYVEIVNLVFGVYDRSGNLLAGPTQLGSLWSGFSVADCTDNSGDPIVLYDRKNDRWILTQFTTRGPTIFYNCVAVSQTSDPAGAYYRYAFSAGPNFPDYPKYGDWSDSYLLTSRDFGDSGGYGISVYGLEKNKMIIGDPNARSVHYFLDSTKVPIATIGDGLLPADVDGALPANGAPAPVVGTQNILGPYGATSDALNIYNLTVDWPHGTSSLSGLIQLPVDTFNSTFPCGGGRACIPEPGTSAKIDFLGYRQRPTWRLAFRKFAGHETMVTNQSVQASAGVAGVRWYEIRRMHGVYSLFQQGTYAPSDGVDRWMGSAAMDKLGNIGLAYSVSDASSVFPGIRFTGRKPTDPPGVMTASEKVLIAGSGSQLTSNNRWGDYTSLNIDPLDSCTFWYVNEYYQTTSVEGWQTRIGSFRLKGC